MAIDREVTDDDSVIVRSDTQVDGARRPGDRPPGAGPADARAASGTPVLSRTAVVVSCLVGILLVAWFFFAWLALDHSVVDAAGESIGSAFAILLLVSLVGAFRHNRHRR